LSVFTPHATDKNRIKKSGAFRNFMRICLYWSVHNLPVEFSTKRRNKFLYG